MLTTNSLHSVVKDGCGVASEAAKCLNRKLRNALYAKWVSRWPSRPHILTDPISLDIWWHYTTVFVVRKLPFYTRGTLFCDVTTLAAKNGVWHTDRQYGPFFTRNYDARDHEIWHLWHLTLGRKQFIWHFVCFWRDSPQWARASSFTRFLDHTQRRTRVGRTSLDEWSARRSWQHTTITTDTVQPSAFRLPWLSFPWFS
jgi:hypothetical protein